MERNTLVIIAQKINKLFLGSFFIIFPEWDCYLSAACEVNVPQGIELRLDWFLGEKGTNMMKVWRWVLLNINVRL